MLDLGHCTASGLAAAATPPTAAPAAATAAPAAAPAAATVAVHLSWRQGSRERELFLLCFCDRTNLESASMEAGRGEGRRESLETIRPWRKKTLQIISTEKWRKESEVTPLPQVEVSPCTYICERL